ncbi:hypothetical protein D1816_03410 [Aquimarina sp. AD10]|uniref:hypothetical protein n=1 Tax=Aquimarina sp. AD10 TaxID=1714849 RepID=UPI000E48958D|nr:hypothetical protein [Aquimarina sp. AD10]AXT59436.1 hypothetical protein D1816_03410 [Aquimarina sp. AD10]RKN00338.1 hypothetical protein D7033_08240 [Aquimarina sp. AD10]
MNKIFLILIFITLFFSCGKDKSKDKEPGLLDAIEGISDLNKMAKEVENLEEENDKLLKATPISNEKLKALLPKELIGFTRKTFTIGNQFMPDVAMAEAEYENENGNIISLSIMDGAGETGSAMITLARLGFARDFEEQSERGYKKSTKINGYKAIEEVEEDDYSDDLNSKIDLLISKRFIVSLEGQSIPLEQLKKAVDQIKLGVLNDIN